VGIAAAISIKSTGVFVPRISVRYTVELSETCLSDQIVELERLDEIGVPDHRAEGDGEVGPGLCDLGDPAQPFDEHISGAEDSAVVLHRAGEGVGLASARRMADPVEPRDRRFRRNRRHSTVRCVRLDDLGGALWPAPAAALANLDLNCTAHDVARAEVF
jgi:hypothetical protein